MRRQFLRFALAGVAGFVIDVGVLYLALHFGAGYYLGRALSFLCAAFATWQINRRHAFAHAAGEDLLHEWLRYLVAMLGGGAVNYGVYALCVALLPPARWIPAQGVALGSLSGLLVNFMGARHWVFRRERRA